MNFTKRQIIQQILSQQSDQPRLDQAQAFAPVNIALCKYWGKRDIELNLPLTASLSIALPNYGTHTQLQVIDAPADRIIVNDHLIDNETEFATKLIAFLDLFRTEKTWHLEIQTTSDVPIAAGLASSASGFSALVLALQQLFQWNLSLTELSILARLGSGSACRSLWPGFVLWQAGIATDGMDSHGIAIEKKWPGLMMGLLIFHQEAKSISSRDAMQRTVTTSQLYCSWPAQVEQDIQQLQQAITLQDFNLLGSTAEHNALSMHATMMSAWPPIIYTSSSTLTAMQKVWSLRAAGIPVYFTQDAGPHLKLLFMREHANIITNNFPELIHIELFQNNQS